MEIRQQSLHKYLHDIAIDQLSEDYINKGYQIIKDEKIGKYSPDLVVKNGDETIVFEVKTGRMTKERKEAIAEIGDYVRKRNNYKFLVVFATPPKKKNLDIENIEELLTKIFDEDYPDELQSLPAVRTQLNEIVNVDVDEIKIEGGEYLSKR